LSFRAERKSVGFGDAGYEQTRTSVHCIAESHLSELTIDILLASLLPLCDVAQIEIEPEFGVGD
jgi:hypothetical protein